MYIIIIVSLFLSSLLFSYPSGLVDQTLFVCLCMRMDVTTFIVSFVFVFAEYNFAPVVFFFFFLLIIT